MVRVALGLFRTVFGLTALVLATLVLGSYVIVLLKLRPHSPQAPVIVRIWGRFFLLVTGTRVTVEGAHRIDPAGSYVFTGNHASNLDIPVLLGHLPVQVRFLAKQELFRVPVLSGAMRALHMVETDRAAGTGAHRAINRQVARVVDSGLSLAIFPEGTRSRDGLMPFKKGAFRIAIDNGMPVVPITILGARRAWPPGGKIVYGGRVRLMIHEPLPTADLGTGDIGPLRDRARAIVETTLTAG